MSELIPIAQTQAEEDLELTCPKQHCQAVVDLSYEPGSGQVTVTHCSLFPDGPPTCQQNCVKH